MCFGVFAVSYIVYISKTFILLTFFVKSQRPNNVVNDGENFVFHKRNCLGEE
jgi:hypothetical protein